jgi:hypothetical protein
VCLDIPGLQKTSVTGWSARQAFSEDAMSEMLTDLELWELAREVPNAVLAGEREKKASASSPTSAPGPSAPDVAANVPTNLAPTSL